MDYPKSNKYKFTENIAGFENQDPYIWLEDREEKNTIEWTEEQNKYTDKYFSGSGKEKLAAELKTKANTRTVHVSARIGNEIFVVFTDMNQKRKISLVDQDFHEIVEFPAPIEGDGLELIPDHYGSGLAIYIMMRKDENDFAFYLYDYKKQSVIREMPFLGEFCWGNEKKIWFTECETNEDGDVKNFIKFYDFECDDIQTVYQNLDNFQSILLRDDGVGNYIAAQCSRNGISGKLILINQKTMEVEELSIGFEAQFTYLGNKVNKHFVLTDLDSERRKIIAFPENGDISEAEDIIPESNLILVDAQIIGDYLLVQSNEDVNARADIYSLNGTHIKQLDLPSKTGSFGLKLGPSNKHTGEFFYFNFESFINAPTLLCFDGNTCELETVYVSEDISIPDNIEVEQKFILSRDGIKLPVYLVYQKETKLGGNNPTLMYGYGGFNLSMQPFYNNMIIGLDIWRFVERGGVYVQCCIRGGGEYGVEWHKAGRNKKKHNTYNDFLDITEWLISNNWTKPKRIAICGGSNGGLLMAVLANLRPYLWACVVSSVPCVDMIHLLKNKPGRAYIGEYGDPLIAEDYEYLLSYSPYHNIKKVHYPPMYIQTGERDPQVPSWNSKKLAARLQEMNQSKHPILLRVLLEGTHDRGSGDVYFQTIAEMQTFIMKHIGLED